MLHFSGSVFLLCLGVGCVPTGLGPCIQTTQSCGTICYQPKLIISLGCCAGGVREDLLSSVLAQPIIKSLSSLKRKLKHLSSTILRNKLYQTGLNDFFFLIYIWIPFKITTHCLHWVLFHPHSWALSSEIWCDRGLIFPAQCVWAGMALPKVPQILWVTEGHWIFRRIVSESSHKLLP